jgi:hypothetical protein
MVAKRLRLNLFSQIVPFGRASYDPHSRGGPLPLEAATSHTLLSLSLGRGTPSVMGDPPLQIACASWGLLLFVTAETADRRGGSRAVARSFRVRCRA